MTSLNNIGCVYGLLIILHGFAYKCAERSEVLARLDSLGASPNVHRSDP